MEASSSNHMDPQSNKGDRRPPRFEESPSSSHHQSQLSEESILKMSDAFYKFYEPTPAHTADMDIIFFHGLESEGADVHDAHISTWRSGGAQGEVWPQSWIPEDFPQARIIAVSYDCCVRKTDTGGLKDLHLIGENLAQEIRWARKEHGYGRPVILVGHGFGGIVMKMLCVYSKNRKGKAVGGSDMAMFLESIRGFFFYSTPHLGIEGIEAPTDYEGPLLSWIRALNSQTSRLHEEFCELWRERTYRWFIFGLGATELESAPRRQRLRVSEASSRFGDRYMMVASDHFSACRPSDKSSVKYQHLKMLIEDVKRQAESERKQSLRVSDVTVGVDVLVTEVLGKHLRDHKFVGFSGMGGVGKTTLAKLIFNHVCAKFEFTCFVEEIKLIPGRREEVKRRVWGKMRLHGVPVSSVTGLSGDGWHQLAGKSLFLVFDDVENTEHIDLLKEIAHDNGVRESRFVLTSRNAQRLQDFGDDGYILRLDCLDKRDTMKLFTAYAFGGQEPPESSIGKEIVKKVVDGCGGLPLSLEVLGKYLRGQDSALWVEIPAALRKCDEIADLEEKVWAKLELSYNGLPGSEVKNIFLDIVSFFTFPRDIDFRFSQDDAIMAWSSTYSSALNRLKLLQDRSLVRVHHSKNGDGEDRTTFSVHEHVRGMGRRITRRIGRTSDFTRPRSSTSSSSGGHNIYSYDDRMVSQEREELGKIVSTRIKITSEPTPVSAESCHFCTMLEVLPKLTSIQYLSLQLGRKCCKRCRKQAVTLPSPLVLLEISGSTGNLVLSVDAACTSLVKLVLHGCEKLSELKHWLAQLQQLRILDIDGWSGTGDWLVSLAKLTSLERLALRGRGSRTPFELPSAFGQLTKLQYLSLDSCEVSFIPTSFRNLTSLRFLRLEIGDKQVIPNVIGDLQQLRVLEIKSWTVDGFMEAIGHLTGLESLAVHCGGIFELPESLGKLTRLKKLEIGCPIDVVPGSLKELGRLEKLQLAPIRSLADTFRNSSSLKCLEPMEAGALHSTTSVTLELPRSELGIMELQASDLIGLRLESLEIKVEGPQIVPDCFGGLQRLESFSLDCLAVENNLVESFQNLIALESLKLGGKGITELPADFGCFTTLRFLTLERTAVQALPETSGKFSQLNNAAFIHNPDLRSLPDSFGQLAQLRSLYVWDSEHFSTLPDTVGSLTNLERLYLNECPIQTLPASFSNLTRLVDLDLRCEDGAVAAAVRNLINLVSLEVMVIGRQPVGDIFGQLSKLESLTLECHDMGNLVESFQNLCLLRYLDLSCETIEELPREIGCLTSLMELEITCPSLQSLPFTLSNLLKLEELEIVESNLRSLPDSFGQLSQLRTLRISSKDLFRVPDTFGDLSSLWMLELDCPIQLLPPSFANLISLTRLKLSCQDGHTAGVLSSLIYLESLEIKVRTGANVVHNAVRKLGNLESFRLAFDTDHQRSETVRAKHRCIPRCLLPG
ncbi:hypothetical protein R1sor_012047 [Riccia sorocarpa]|uniref:NB-ARC domain-containing protein n=1 Tax=Riccia sorocarpa TaxID=122646 RepID=A0ABD3I3K5_9MARC